VTAAGRRAGTGSLPAVVAWWGALFGVWFLFAGQGGWPVAVWGAVAAALGVAAARLVAGRALRTGRPNVRRAARLLRIARRTAADFGIVTAVLARGMTRGRRGRHEPVGRFARRDLGDGGREGGDEGGTGTLTATATAWRALAASCAPGSYVLDVDASGRALVHELPLRRPRRARRPCPEVPE
jgi:hypothetical protein